MRLLLVLAASALAGAMGSVPVVLHDNRIVADVQIDGKGPFKFIFDTGGTNVLTPEAARRLGLKTEAAGEDTGAGDRPASAGRAAGPWRWHAQAAPMTTNRTHRATARIHQL